MSTKLVDHSDLPQEDERQGSSGRDDREERAEGRADSSVRTALVERPVDVHEDVIVVHLEDGPASLVATARQGRRRLAEGLIHAQHRTRREGPEVEHRDPVEARVGGIGDAQPVVPARRGVAHRRVSRRAVVRDRVASVSRVVAVGTQRSEVGGVVTAAIQGAEGDDQEAVGEQRAKVHGAVSPVSRRALCWRARNIRIFFRECQKIASIGDFSKIT